VGYMAWNWSSSRAVRKLNPTKRRLGEGYLKDIARVRAMPTRIERGGDRSDISGVVVGRQAGLGLPRSLTFFGQINAPLGCVFMINPNCHSEYAMSRSSLKCLPIQQ
jgi:hypothetical protein